MKSGKVPWDSANVYPNPSCSLHTECFHVHFSVWLLIFLPIMLPSKSPRGWYCATPYKIFCDQAAQFRGSRCLMLTGWLQSDVSAENQQNCFSSPLRRKMIMDKKYFLPLMHQSVAGDSEDNLHTFKTKLSCRIQVKSLSKCKNLKWYFSSILLLLSTNVWKEQNLPFLQLHCCVNHKNILKPYCCTRWHVPSSSWTEHS